MIHANKLKQQQQQHLFYPAFLRAVSSGRGVNLTSPSDLGPKGADFALMSKKIVKTHVKCIATIFLLPKTVYLLYYYNL